MVNLRLAVVDGQGHFVGVIPPHRLLTVLLSEHEEDLSRFAGFLKTTSVARATSEERVPRRFRHRLPWLLLGLGGALLAADLVGAFETHLQLNLMLAFFIPGIVYLADAVGTQTETVVVRGLSLGVPMRRMVGRELLTGVLIGMALAVGRRAVRLVALERRGSGAVAGIVGIRGVLDSNTGGHDAALALRHLRVGSGLRQRSSCNRRSRSLVHLDLSVRHDFRHVIIHDPKFSSPPHRNRAEDTLLRSRPIRGTLKSRLNAAEMELAWRSATTEQTRADRATTTTNASGATTADAMEQRVVAFAEQLGRMVGTIQAKAEGWMDRETLNKQIASVRDGAAHLLEQLAGGATKATKKKAGRRGGARRKQGAQRRRGRCARQETS